MIYLILSILCSIGIFLSFKLAQRFKIFIPALITINYFVAIAFGSAHLLLSHKEFKLDSLNSGFLFSGLAIGFLFVVMFFVASYSIKQAGVGISSAASKLSVVFPFFFSILIDKDDYFTLLKALAISVVILSILLLSFRKNEHLNITRFAIYPIVLFVGMGVVDSLIKLAQYFYVPQLHETLFSVFVFSAAAVVSSIYLISISGFKGFSQKAFVGGLGLGLSNYGSLFFFIKALNNPGIILNSSSVIFTVNNVSIILLTTFAGMTFFREKLSIPNYIGLALAMGSLIVLISLNK